MKSKLLGLIACVALIGPADAAEITYNVDIVSGVNSIIGTLSTDGTLGTGLTASNFVGWDLTASNGSTHPVTLDCASSCGSLITFVNNVGDFDATASLLTLDYPDIQDGSELFIESVFENPADGSFSLRVANFTPNSDPGGTINITDTDGSLVTTAPTSDVIGSVTVATTPLPAALPLFGAGIGVFGLFARRKKRKASAALAVA